MKGCPSYFDQCTESASVESGDGLGNEGRNENREDTIRPDLQILVR